MSDGDRGGVEATAREIVQPERQIAERVADFIQTGRKRRFAGEQSASQRIRALTPPAAPGPGR